jgi:uncharacterized protein (DUF1330 family)
MSSNRKIALAALAGVAFGAAVTGLYAQSASKPPAFYLAEHVVSDPEGFKPYGAAVPKTLEPYGGRFVVRGARPVALEGEEPKGRYVVIAFDSMDKAKSWYESPAYQALIPVRQKAAKSRALLVEGMPANSIGRMER